MSATDVLTRDPARRREGPPEPVPGRAGGSGAPLGWRDLAIVGFVAVLGLLPIEGPLLLRVPVGLAAVLIAPGYGLIAAVFPGGEDIDLAERLGLSLATSFALIIIEALVLDKFPHGLSPGSIRATVGLVSLFLLVWAGLRRRRWQALAPPFDPRAVQRRGVRRAVRFTQALVVANLAVGAFAFAITVGDAQPVPTEFYVLGNDGLIAAYPKGARPGEEIDLRLGVKQATTEAGRYSIQIRQNAEVVGSVDAVDVAPGATWEQTATVALPTAGRDQELTLDLYRRGDEKAFRTLRLWVDVTPGARA